jgi:hypothetical protein
MKRFKRMLANGVMRRVGAFEFAPFRVAALLNTVHYFLVLILLWS